MKQGWINEEDVTIEALEGFLGRAGRKFYGIEDVGNARERRKIRLVKRGEKIVDFIDGKEENGEGFQVVPFGKEKEVWSVEWI